MSLGNTSKLIEESRKIVEASNDNSVLSLIFEIVTKIDNRMIQMEKNMGKRLDDMKADFLAVSARVRSLKDKVTNFRKTLTECENSCQGVNNLFDQADSQIKHNTRNIIHQDTRIKKLEEKPVVQPVIQPFTESGQIKTLTADILVTLSSRDLTLAETARKSAFMSSKRFPIFFSICIILLSIFVTISRIKLSTELSLDASTIFLLSSMSFDVIETRLVYTPWQKLTVENCSQQCNRKLDFGPTS
jgi:archaellum component FlaC